MSDPQFQIVAGGGNSFQLIGELDMDTVGLFEAALVESLQENGDTVTLDLSELSFIDSSGLHALARYARDLNGDGPLAIVNTPSFILRVFEIVGLDQSKAVKIT